MLDTTVERLMRSGSWSYPLVLHKCPVPSFCGCALEQPVPTCAQSRSGTKRCRAAGSLFAKPLFSVVTWWNAGDGRKSVWLPQDATATKNRCVERKPESVSRLLCCLAAATVVLLTGPVTRADDDLFRQRVVPVLARRCLSCHDDTLRKGDLSFRTGNDLPRWATSSRAIPTGVTC